MEVEQESQMNMLIKKVKAEQIHCSAQSVDKVSTDFVYTIFHSISKKKLLSPDCLENGCQTRRAVDRRRE